MCINHSNYENSLLYATGADVVYSKDYDDTRVYALSHATARPYAAVNGGVVNFDKRISNSGTSSFLSLSSGLNGKVKMFRSGEHVADEYFNHIFSIKVNDGQERYELRPGVKVFKRGMETMKEDAHLPSHVAAKSKHTAKEIQDDNALRAEIASLKRKLEASEKRDGVLSDRLDSIGGKVDRFMSGHSSSGLADSVMHQDGSEFQSFVEQTNKKIAKLDAENYELERSISGCLSELNDNVTGSSEVTHVKLACLDSKIDQVMLAVQEIKAGMQAIDAGIDRIIANDAQIMADQKVLNVKVDRILSRR